MNMGIHGLAPPPPGGRGLPGYRRADWHPLAGVGAGAVALARRRSLVVVFLLAIATTAVGRAIA